jgi:formylglycine-generating enzyme required for sulfatase activity
MQLKSLLFFYLIFTVWCLDAQTRNALVIGNSSYKYAGLGKSPIESAKGMRDLLKKAGFDVEYHTDLDQQAMANVIANFGIKVKKNKGTALFYYVGHGVQHHSMNYLVPIGAELSQEDEIEGLCVPVNRVAARMQDAGTDINIIILDACRAFPLKRGSMSLTQGLAKETFTLPELLVAYATAPGGTADLEGENNLTLYTSQLLRHMSTPDLVLEEVFKKTRIDVINKSNNRQRPDESSNLTSYFYFFRQNKTTSKPPLQPSVSAPPLPADITAETQGLEDSDLDKVFGSDDKCPDEYGSPDAGGCPDYDEDGIPNKDDLCPMISGPKKWNGCPDSDKDEIPDHKDKCPEEKGMPANNGCPPPDQDRDGVPDEGDLCPREAGKKELSGCPDIDNDGVADKSDRCPEKAGLPRYQGCPDSDQDGFPDHEDKCPYTKSKNSRDGCPDLSAFKFGLQDFALVKKGRFRMGSSNGQKEELPVHQVTVESFEISKKEITNAQFVIFLNQYGGDKVKSGPYSGEPIIFEHERSLKKSGNKWQVASGFEQHPVVCVTWYGASAYCDWLSQKTDLQYRLPSEAEWEYAAKEGMSQTQKYAGSDKLGEVAWHAENSGAFSHPVGHKQPNSLGCYDMTGNVWEWCSDAWHESYIDAPSTGEAWTESGNEHVGVIRGGSWDSDYNFCRTTFRLRYNRAKEANIIGFRIVRSIPTN